MPESLAQEGFPRANPSVRQPIFETSGLVRAMGFLQSQHGQLDAIPFTDLHAKWGCDTPPPPHTRGVSQRYFHDTL